MHLYYLDVKLSFPAIFITFQSEEATKNYKQHVDILGHETYTNNIFFFMQQLSVLLCLDHVFSDHMTIRSIHNCISQGNQFIKSLFTEVKECLTTNRKYTLISVNSG